jgi:hypothetical protein
MPEGDRPLEREIDSPKSHVVAENSEREREEKRRREEEKKETEKGRKERHRRKEEERRGLHARVPMQT